MFIAHGTDDRIVPVDQSRELVDRLRAAERSSSTSKSPAPTTSGAGPSVPDIVGRSLDFLAARMRID